MPEKKNISVYVRLEDEAVERFLEMKKEIGVKSDAEAMRAILKRYYDEIFKKRK